MVRRFLQGCSAGAKPNEGPWSHLPAAPDQQLPRLQPRIGHRVGAGAGPASGPCRALANHSAGRCDVDQPPCRLGGNEKPGIRRLMGFGEEVCCILGGAAAKVRWMQEKNHHIAAQ